MPIFREMLGSNYGAYKTMHMGRYEPSIRDEIGMQREGRRGKASQVTSQVPRA